MHSVAIDTPIYGNIFFNIKELKNNKSEYYNN